jgi:hypothetical protein
MGSFEELLAAGFDIDQILNSYNKQLKTDGEKNA